MAIVAGNFNMSSGERKVRLQIVIERPFIPPNRVVAGRALVIEITAMRIVIRMAGNALRFGVREYLSLVTVNTFCLTMHAKQWKGA